MLSIAQIQAAQNNDLSGVAALLAEMDERIATLAARAARRLDGGHREDFEQDAREALFLALPRVDVTGSADSAIGFLYTCMADALKDKVRAERYQGADKDAVKVFMSVLAEADSDPYVAERLAQTVPAKGVRLSADRAQAARLAWQGAASIDKTSGDDEQGVSIADTLAVADETPDVIRPKVGAGAALEALAVLQRYGTNAKLLNALPADADGVYAIEDSLTTPRDAAERRYVLDAVAILHSYVSTATEGEVVEDLRTVADERSDERAAKIGMIRAALEKCSPTQRLVLKFSFGIDDHKCYGFGDGCDDEGLSAETGMAIVTSLRPARSKGLKSFAKNYIALAAGSEAEAVALNEAAAKNLARGGRK